MPKDFLQGASLTPTFEALMVKFGGKIGTLYQMLKNAFKKYSPQNRTNVQIKGGGVKGLLKNVQKNFTFLWRWLPLEEGEGVGVPAPYGKCLIFPICLLPHLDKIQKNSSIF